jgi:hypothetical protein
VKSPREPEGERQSEEADEEVDVQKLRVIIEEYLTSYEISEVRWKLSSIIIFA